MAVAQRGSTASARPSRAGSVRPSGSPKADQRARLRVVRHEETLRSRHRSRRYFVLCITAVLLAMFVLIGGHVLLAQNQARLDQLRREVIQNRDQYDELRLEVAQLRSPERIVSEAEAMGLGEPKSVTYVQPVPVTPSGSAQALAPEQSAALDDPASTQQKVDRWEEIKPNLDGRP